MLQITNLKFSYHNNFVLEGINFSIQKGDCTAVIGESGCGKSTLLKLLYGLFDLEEGTIFWDHQEILGPKFKLIPGMDFIKYLAQDFDLMPYITVAENVGKHLSNINPEIKKARILELLEVVEMTKFADTKAKNLSGGQMQRVAIARALALEPEILLLDEPFSHIDNFKKNSLRRNLFSFLKQKQITTLVASHDATDILSFTDEVIVMKNGRIIEKSNTKQCFSNPKNHYIASLFDDVNEINSSFFVDDDIRVLLVYPHQIQIVETSKLKTVVTNCFFEGKQYRIESLLDSKKYYFMSPDYIEIGTNVCLDLNSNFFNKSIL